LNLQKSIVIVEDERDTGEMFAEMLRLRGYQTHNAFGGSAALSLIAEKEPDVILLDLMMPDISGLEIMEQLHQDQSLADIPIVIISAKTMPTDIQAGLRAGAANYLTKPVSFTDLIQAIEPVLQSDLEISE
jgi:CheY-like chemotaxis protein